MALIKIVGAGQLGSRHLQALQAVKQPLEIYVVDPSPESLVVAESRFRAVEGESRHSVRFTTSLEATGPTDVAIVATSADARLEAAQGLLRASPVRFMVLEKLLFDRRGDYAAFSQAISSTGAKVWVNCPMRMMAPYERIRAEIGGQPIAYRVTGSRFGLVTNAIHYLDHLAHMSGCRDFIIDAGGLDPEPIQSKRAGFLEFNGRLVARFGDGSHAEIVCHADGDAPVLVELSTPSARYIVRENEGRLWASSAQGQWRWEEREARIPYQSEMTTQVVEGLLAEGACPLSPLDDASHIHLALLEPLLRSVQAHNPEITHYPFT